MRDQYVFKMIPLLNPDGVKRGHYRTDPRGVNLNRVYIDPDPFLHPSIFAAKSVIMYHHGKGTAAQNVACSCDKRPFSNGTSASIPGEVGVTFNQGSQPDDVSSEHNLLSGSAVSSLNPQTEASIRASLTELDKPSASPDFDSARLELESVTSGSVDEKERNKNESTSTDICINLEALDLKDEFTESSNKRSCTLNGELGPERDYYPDFPERSSTNVRTENVQQELASPDKAEPFSEMISSKNCACQCAPPAGKESGIAFYVDLHGHASKRGCFVYANYLENEEDYVRTILFPKLVSLNSSHFDFTACNFTEKNMYSKDKRDGMSKEGSGRVAIYKATGIIHRYDWSVWSSIRVLKCDVIILQNFEPLDVVMRYTQLL